MRSNAPCEPADSYVLPGRLNNRAWHGVIFVWSGLYKQVGERREGKVSDPP